MEFLDYTPNKIIGDYWWNHQAKIGSGSFGMVYLGFKKNNKKDIVAIKIMDKKKITGECLQKALHNELNILKLLKGPNTCGMLNHYPTSNNHYIIVPFCNGGDLRKYLNKKVKVSEEEGLKIIRNIIRGMNELYNNDIAHRDLKPDNILINDDIFKVADFGFSTLMNGESMKEKCGTPLYMSPQALQGLSYTSKCDVWSLGIIYYEMLFSRTPWQVKNISDLINMPKSIPVMFPANIPISLMSKNFIINCLKYDEQDRYSWKDIFLSELFMSDKLFNLSNLSPDTIQILKELQELVQKKNLNLKQIFDNFDKDQKHILSVEQLNELLRFFRMDVSMDQSTQIMKQYDTSLDGGLSFDEFQTLVLYSDFNVDQNQEDNEFLAEIKAQKVIKQLTQIITFNQIDIKILFDTLDKSKDGTLDNDELKVMLKNIDKNITENEIAIVFRLFDKNKDGSISFNEFQEILFNSDTQNSKQKYQQEQMQQQQQFQQQNQQQQSQSYSKIPSVVYKSEDQSQINNSLIKKKCSFDSQNSQELGNNSQISDEIKNKYQNGIKLLRILNETISINDLDLNMMFNHFDQDQSGFLDEKEFFNFVKAIQIKANENDIKDAFTLLDKSKDNLIDILEFKIILLKK